MCFKKVYFFEIIYQENAFSNSEYIKITTHFTHFQLVSSNTMIPGNHEH